MEIGSMIVCVDNSKYGKRMKKPQLEPTVYTVISFIKKGEVLIQTPVDGLVANADCILIDELRNAPYKFSDTIILEDYYYAEHFREVLPPNKQKEILLAIEPIHQLV